MLVFGNMLSLVLLKGKRTKTLENFKAFPLATPTTKFSARALI